MRRLVFLAGVCGSALTCAGAGTAMAADDKTQAAAPLEEIVVTAERRVQSVQKSSLAITVFSSRKLVDAGVTQTRDITKIAPGVVIGQGGPATQIYIRGVGDFGSEPNTNPAVATNIDGVYISRANAIEGNFYDLQRIEVLKGPQGTLYGRNASGGAINIITNPPRFASFSGHFETEIGDYDLIRSEGDLNGTIGDTLALRGAFQVVNRNGFDSGGFDDDKEQSFRLSALWKPNDRLSVRLTGDYEHSGGIGPGYVFKGLDPAATAYAQATGTTIPSDPRLPLTDPRTFGAFNAAIASGGLCIPNGVIPAASSTHSGTLQAPQGLCPTGFGALVDPPSAKFAGQNDKDANFTAQTDYDLDFAKLTIIPAYRYVANEYVVFPNVNYTSYAPGHPERSDTESLEMRLGNSGPRLTWVAGAYFYREDQNVPFYLGSGGEEFGTLSGNAYQQFDLRTDSHAAFGQATYSITPKWRLIAGARYSSDTKYISGINQVYDTPLSFPFSFGSYCFGKASPCTNLEFGGKKTFDKVTYKAGTEYDLTPHSMLYLTYATGEKAGGFNLDPKGAYPADKTPLPYRPEKLSALEVGSRNRFRDSRLQVNVEGFYWKYKDAQENFSYLNSNGPQLGTTNAGQATMYGADLSVDAKLTEADTFTTSAEYLHSRFDKFVFTSSGLTSGTTGCKISPDGPLQSIDCSGKQLIRAPEWSGTAELTHEFTLASDARITASISTQFAAQRYLGTDYTPNVKTGAYAEGDFITTYHSPNDKWSLAAYVRNFNDALIYTGTFTTPQLVPGLTIANVAPPRTYGARFAINF